MQMMTDGLGGGIEISFQQRSADMRMAGGICFLCDAVLIAAPLPYRACTDQPNYTHLPEATHNLCPHTDLVDQTTDRLS